MIGNNEMSEQIKEKVDIKAKVQSNLGIHLAWTISKHRALVNIGRNTGKEKYANLTS